MGKEKAVRYPVVSGLFYPDTREELESNIQGYLGRIDEEKILSDIAGQTGLDASETCPLAAIAPHAGYIYSGKVQAHVYGAIRRFDLDAVVIIGPSHQNRFSGVSVNTDGLYQTPLGEVQVDVDFGRALADTSALFQFHEEAHLGEHAIEVQVPFVQVVFPHTPIVPVLFGEQSFENAEALAQGLRTVMEAMPGRRMVIASTDLSHYHSHVDASSLDHALMEDIRNMDPASLNRHVAEGRSEACGFAAILTVMMLSRDRGNGKAALLSYTDSGETSGNRSNVVGYLSALLY